MDSFSFEKIITIFFSTLTGIFAAIFLVDHLKALAKDMCRGVAAEIRKMAYIPMHVSDYRIIRLLYILGILLLSALAHIYIQPLTTPLDLLFYAVLSAIAIPVIVFSSYIFLVLLWEVCAALGDFILYFGWVPYHLYKERNSPSSNQLLMLWGWILFCGIFLGLLCLLCQSFL